MNEKSLHELNLPSTKAAALQCRRLMLLGTSSSVGKSLLTAGLARLFTRRGLKVLPFKSQNMSSNSYVFSDGREISKAQVMQAEACKAEPLAEMNPLLLKPLSDQGSEVFFLGRKEGVLRAADYYREKKKYWPGILAAFDSLARQADLVLVEGAGSPAEINLKSDDFVNLGLAKRLNMPALLIGDIDRGGVFASLYGTLGLIEPEENELIRALIINKFRGDIRLLEPGLRQLEELCHKPVLGVLPMLDLHIDDEDSLSAAEHGGSPVTSREERELVYERLADEMEKQFDMALLEKIIEDSARMASSHQLCGEP